MTNQHLEDETGPLRTAPASLIQIACSVAAAHDAKATPGPWNDIRVGRQGTGEARSHEEQICNADGVGVAIVTHDGSPEAHANVHMMTMARTRWPELARMTSALLEENEVLRAQIEKQGQLLLGRADMVSAAKEALILLTVLTEDEDGPWRPEIVRLHDALEAAGEITRIVR